MAASRPVRHGDSMVPAVQEHASPIRSRADQTTLAAGGGRHPPQPSSAVVSAVVVGASFASFASAFMRKLTRCAAPPLQIEPASLGFDLVFGTGDRVLPHTAFVLTWFKIKKRQASASGMLRTLKYFCCKGFQLYE